MARAQDRVPSGSCARLFLMAGVDPGGDTRGGHVSVVLFSGVDRSEGLGWALRSRGARAVIMVDVSVGGTLHDLLDQTPDALGWHLFRAARREEINSLDVAIPCETLSESLDDEDMVRSSASPDYHIWPKRAPSEEGGAALRVKCSRPHICGPVTYGIVCGRAGDDRETRAV